jgi:hypothetical protein
MIEIEVEMETDVLAAGTTSDVVNHFDQYFFYIVKSCYRSSYFAENVLVFQDGFTEQIEQIMELENLEEVYSPKMQLLSGVVVMNIAKFFN